jgi:cell division protein FtsB
MNILFKCFQRFVEFVILNIKIFAGLFVLFLVILIVYNLIFGQDGLVELYTMKMKIRDTEAKLAKLKEENRSLEDEKWKLLNDPDYAEKVMREEFNYKKKGEKILKFNLPEEKLTP